MDVYADKINKSEQVRTFAKLLRVVLDAKYENSDLNEVMKKQCQHLTETQSNELLELLQKIEEFFDGTLDTWKTDQVDFEFTDYVKPICPRPYIVPKLHK